MDNGRKGFARAGESNTLNPEYVKLQRASEVKKYQDAVLDQQEKLKAIEKRKREIESEISAAYADRAAKLTAAEAALEAQGKALSAHSKDLDAREAKLQKDIKQHEAHQAEALAVNQKQTEKNQASLDLATEKKEESRINRENVAASLKVISEQQADLAAREAALQDGLIKLAKDRLAFDKEVSGLDSKRQLASDAEQILRISRADNKSAIEQLTAARAEMQKTKAKLKEQLAQLAVDRDNNTRIHLSNLETAKVLKEQQKALDDREAKLKARETAGSQHITGG